MLRFIHSAKYFNKEQLERFKKITSPFILRRLNTDKSIINDLPEKMERDCFVQLTKEQTALYQEVVNTMLDALNNTEEHSIERSQFLKKEDDRVALSGKTEMLLGLLSSIYENDEKVLIFTQYKEMGEILARIVEAAFDTKPLFLHGGVARQKRDEMVEPGG